VLLWSLLIFFFITFLVILIALVVSWLALQKRAVQRAEESMDAEQDPAILQRLLKNEQLSSISIWQSLLARFDAVEIMRRHIGQAGLTWSIGRVTLLMLLAGSITLYLAVHVSWIPLWAAAGSAWFVALCPYLYIRARRSKRFQKFREAFPDALDSLSRALKAGYPIIAALELVANEADEPVSSEFRKTFVEANLGVPWEQALGNLGERIPLIEVNIFGAAVQIHTRTGGRMSDVIARLTDNMREQVALQGEVRSIAAHGKLTGLILTIVPVGIAGMMMIVSPSYIQVLLHHPYGKDMIAAAVVMLVAAHFVMRRIVDIEI
jgi:tight adherence protein B